MLIEARRGEAHSSWYTWRDSGSCVRIRTFESLRYGLHQSTRHARTLETSYPVVRCHLCNTVGDRTGELGAMRYSSSVGLQRVVIRQLPQSKRMGARTPLSVASHGDHDWAVGRVE